MALSLPPQLKRLLGYLRPYALRLTLGIVLVAFVAGAEGLVALMVKLALDFVLNPGATSSLLPLGTIPGTHRVVYLNDFFPQPPFHNVWPIFSLSLIVLFFCKALAEYLGATQIQHVGQAAVTDLRNQVYARLIRQPIGFFQHNPTGRVISTVINDVERARLVLSDYLADIFQKGFTFLVFVGVMVYLNWKMALGAAVLLPLVVLPVNKFGGKIRRSSENSQTRLGDLSQILQETVSGNRVVKAFGMEEFESKKFREAARKLLRENMRWVRAAAATGPLMDLLGAIIIPLLLLYARDEIKHGVMTSGIFLAFIYAMFNSYMPIKRIGYIYQQFQAALGASSKVFAYLDRQEEVSEVRGAKPLASFSREIIFENVGFAYDSESGAVLESIQFQARCGEVIALVGSSGAGKTTLVNLLPRFYEATSGDIRIDGVSTRDVTIKSLREQISMVTQENILFYDTVWSNICYGLTGVPKERVIAAAQAALAEDFILALPNGYNTVIGERGTRLSGGQRQRIAIARAILKDSPILILDEATSELDAESELYVQKALANLMVGRTTFVIAHRLSTIRRADKILVLEDGQIRESGRHDELIARGGIYARLYELQFADEDLLTPAQASPANLESPESLMSEKRTSNAKHPECLSMTGYAQARHEKHGWVVRVTVKSVNHRFLDLKMRLPEGFDLYDLRLRQLVRERIHRGHLEIYVNAEPGTAAPVQVNKELAEAYLRAAESLMRGRRAAGRMDVVSLLRLPGVIAGVNGALPEDADDQEKLGKALEICLREALLKLDEMRRAEGKHLVAELRDRLARIAGEVEQVSRLAASLRPAFARRLETRLKELLGGTTIDQARLAQEAALLAERSDISEELDRLRSHLQQFTKLLDGAGELGKKLDFLLQEMHREANTMLSKTPGVESEALVITGLALEIKAEIEKLREQVQNIE